MRLRLVYPILALVSCFFVVALQLAVFDLAKADQSASPSATGDATVTPSALLESPSSYNGKRVAVPGVVERIRELYTRHHDAYDDFRLCDAQCVSVFIRGRPSITNGQNVTVHGTFQTAELFGEYTYKNVIEADDDSL